MTAATTGTVSYKIYNNTVVLFLGGAITGTSNTTSMTMTGLPAAIRPTQSRTIVTLTTDNNTTYASSVGIVDNTGVITFGKLSGAFYSLGAFTAASIKGLNSDWVLSYPLS